MSSTRLITLLFICFVSRAHGFELTLEYEPVYNQGYSKRLVLNCPEKESETTCSVGNKKIPKAQISSLVAEILSIEKGLGSQEKDLLKKELRISYQSTPADSFIRDVGAMAGNNTKEARIFRRYRQLLVEMKRVLRRAK